MNHGQHKLSVGGQNCAVTFSRGIRAIRHIERFIGVNAVVSPDIAARSGAHCEAVLVWGRKDNSLAALRYAKMRELPVLYLEDGWIRSSSRQAHSRTCYSLLVDDSGVYYDSRTPSALENLLNLEDAAFNDVCTDTALDYARRCRDELVANDITKYNYCTSTTQRWSDRALVLLVDQTRDDASVRFGGMDEIAFARMLESAMDENPDAQIVLRTHPDVVAGRRKGYLSSLAARYSLSVSADGSNPLALVNQARRVYAATSQLGYEAMLCGTPVTVFGQPFYAGWGVSDDRQAVARRTRHRSIDQLFFASHVHHARYCNPVTGAAWQLHDCLEHVKLQKHYFRRNARSFHCVGIAPWKRRYVRQYLRSPDGSMCFSSRSLSAKLPPTAQDTWVTWSYRHFDPVSDGPRSEALASNSPVVRFEDGFLRSTGLGSDFNAPASLVLDSRGLYFDPAQSSDLEHLLNHHDCSIAQIARAVRLRALILSSRLSKYNVGSTGNAFDVPAGRRVLLVVGQVEDDESIRRGCVMVRTNADLLQSVRSTDPSAWIIYKPHPDVVAGNRQGRVPKEKLMEYADVVVSNASIVECIDACEELHTMTSQAGFEALLKGKQVVTYGAPFYSGWGLTRDLQVVPRRSRNRTIDELVYLTLIAYPRYVDIATGEFTTPEDLVETLNTQRAMKRDSHNAHAPWSVRQWSKAANIVRGLRYAP